MSGFTAKSYQQDGLDCLTDYLKKCREENDPAIAFAKATNERYGKTWGYTPLAGDYKDMPYFCLRVPVGGGKTWLAAKSVKLINQHLLRAEHSVILWLTSSNAICNQTLAGLKNLDHPLHAALSEAGEITVLSLDEAKSVTRATLDTSTVVIVATRQAFQVDAGKLRENEHLRKVYASSGELKHHFDNLAPEAKELLLMDTSDGQKTLPYSLVNVLRLRRPFIIVDEAHNNRTELAFDTLGRFLPSGIMELTATPDTTSAAPSNVLFSVSAAEMKNEDMIKLPINLDTISDWRECLAYAIACRDRLQNLTDNDWNLSGKKPVMLIQSQPKSAVRETVHAHAIRDELVNNQNIPEEEICIATGEDKGLEALASRYELGLNDPACPVKYVITQKALAEGWDCPWAYVLVSVANISSSTAVEQLLGRILRQPDATRKNDEALNQSYAFITSRDFSSTAQALADQLVKVAGFEHKDASQFITRAEDSWLDLFASANEIEIPLEIDPQPLLDMAQDKFAWNNEKRKLTILTPLAETELKAAQDNVGNASLCQQIADISQKIRHDRERRITPAQQGVIVKVPQLTLITRENGVERRSLFVDAAGQLKPVVRLGRRDAQPTDKEIELVKTEKSSSGKIDMDKGKVAISSFMNDAQHALDLSYTPEHWDQTRLAAWLCRQIPTQWLPHELKLAIVQNWLTELFKHVPLTTAIRKKSTIRSLLENRLTSIAKNAVQTAGQAALFTEAAKDNFKVDNAYAFEFPQAEYFPVRTYGRDSEWGWHDFQKHYYPQIGEFDSKEEFECARFLDNEAVNGRLKFWIRNLAKNRHSFSLTVIDRNFYPDFVCVLPDDRILVVEYKGKDRWDTPKVREDREIGKLWAELSGGLGEFVMVTEKDWDKIGAVLHQEKIYL